MNLNIANKLFYGGLDIKILNIQPSKQAQLPASLSLSVRDCTRTATRTDVAKQMLKVKERVNSDGRASMHVHSLPYNYTVMHHRCLIPPSCSSLNVLCTISYHLRSPVRKG